MNRTTLGFAVRAVGFNPEAARYGGISVARNYFLAMAIAGAFAGLAGAIDVTGWEYQIGPADIQASQIGFIGLAAALLGRNTAVGIGFASLLFGGLITGTSSRQLDPTIFRPDLAENLTIIIQGLVVLFVGLNLGGLWAWRRAAEARRAADGAPGRVPAAGADQPQTRPRRSASRASCWARSRSGSRCRRSRRARLSCRSRIGLLAIAAGIWAASRERTPGRGRRDRRGCPRDRAWRPRDALVVRAPGHRRRLGRARRGHARVTRRRSPSPRSAASTASAAA